jgi:hypothetical protein
MIHVEIYTEAVRAGRAAAEPAKGQEVVIGDGKGENYLLPDFPCGFAWVEFKGTTPWARWAKAKGIASKGYPSGMQIWVSEYGQSMTKKAAFAGAFARVLQEHGIPCSARSRMD